MNANPRPSEPVRGRSTLRWPVWVQMLLPMVSVVLLASFLGTGLTAYWIAARVRREQHKDLHRVGRTLAEATFPLTERVMDQMSGLSGAEFALLDTEGRIWQRTGELPPEGFETLTGLVSSGGTADASAGATVSLGDRDYLVDSVAVSHHAAIGGPATLLILYPEDKLASRVYEAIQPALISGAFAAAIALLITIWLARRFVRPVQALAARTATIARGDFAPMQAPRRNDEIRDLVASINRMAERLADYEQQVRQHERIRTLGQLGAAMAHQLRNAATGGRMAIELHRRDCPRGAADESLEVALGQLRLMESYLSQFLSIGRSPPASHQPVDIGQVVEEVLGLLRPSFAHGGIDVQLSAASEPMVVQGDAESLRQLVSNLVLNAVEAAGAGGVQPPRVQIHLGLTGDGTGSVSVRDTGQGPPESLRERLFDPFVTAKPNGVGLGLFVARQVAESHGGRVGWERRGEMTEFVFEFPLSRGSSHGTHPDR